MTDIRQMRYFCVTVQEASIKHAAVRLGVGESAICKQISSIESELGKKLMDRRVTPIRLTDEGKAFLRFCISSLNGYDRLLDDLSSSSVCSGRLSIGFLPFAPLGIITGLLKEFLTDHPMIIPEIRQLPATVLYDDVSGCDFVVCLRYRSGSSLYPNIIPNSFPGRLYHSFEKVDWGLLFPSDIPLSTERFIDPERLLKLPLILPSGSTCESMLISWTAHHGTAPREKAFRKAAMSGGISESVAMTDSGIGYALVPDGISAMDIYSGKSGYRTMSGRNSLTDRILPVKRSGIRFVPLGPPLMSELVIYGREEAELTNAGRAFAEHLRVL